MLRISLRKGNVILGRPFFTEKFRRLCDRLYVILLTFTAVDVLENYLLRIFTNNQTIFLWERIMEGEVKIRIG